MDLIYNKFLRVKKIQVFEDQQVDIKINPNGNLVGPVSVELIPTK